MVDKFFITNAEADFFRVLRAVVGERGHTLAQVSLKQLLYFPGKGELRRQRWRSKVAIELDEPSHAWPDWQTRMLLWLLGVFR